MARETRQQRRARRAEQARSAPDGEQQAPAAAAQRARQQVRAAEVVKTQPPPERRPGSGVFRFVLESWAELRKVEWPTQRQVIHGTAVVLIACIVVGVYLYAADQAFQNLVEKVFLGQ
jgi:preprotein translocase subunit SecE